MGTIQTAMTRPWTPERDRQLLDLFARLPATEVAARLGCSADAVYQRAKALGFRKVAAPARAWTDAENDRLVELYPSTDNRVLAKLFGRTQAAICQQARKMGALKAAAAPAAQDDEPEAPYTAVEIAPGHRRIHFGRQAPHNHGLSPRNQPRGASSLWSIYL